MYNEYFVGQRSYKIKFPRCNLNISFYVFNIYFSNILNIWVFLSVINFVGVIHSGATCKLMMLQFDVETVLNNI